MPQPLVWAALQVPASSTSTLWLTTSLVGIILGATILTLGGAGGGLVKHGRERVRKFKAEHCRLVEKARDISQKGAASGSGGERHGKSGRMREVTLRRIAREAARQIRLSLLVPATLFSVGLALVNMTEPLVIASFWDSVEAFRTARDLRPPLSLLAQRAALVLSRYLLNVTVGFLFARARCDMTLRMRHEVFSRLLRRDTSFYDGVSSADLLERLKRDPETLEDFVNHCLERVLMACIDLLCGIYLVRNYPIYLWGGSFILKALPLTLLTLRAGKLVSTYSVVQRHCLAEADAVAAEALGNIIMVRTHAAEASEEERHADKTRRYQDALLHTLLTENLFRHLRLFTRQTMELGFVMLGAYCMVFEGLTMGRLLAFRSCLDMAIRGFNTLADLYGQACKLRRTSVRYFDLLDQAASIEDTDVAAVASSAPQPSSHNNPQETTEDNSKSRRRRRPATCEGRLRLEGVSFFYPARPTTPVLDNVSLELSPGRVLALCGQSGMGKSTVIKLIQRLYDPTAGRITLDGVDVRELDLGWYRQNVGYVPQEAVLFDRSIAENIAFGLRLVEEAVEGGGGGGEAVVTMEDVQRAAMLSHAHEFIMALPQGYETRVGAAGVLLSGGQRQRIAIARAVIRNPRLLLLDEATNQLDPESEAAIQLVIENLLPGRSVVVIAHRMATIRKADTIAVIHQGCVVQMGRHEQLVAELGGKYLRLLAGQEMGRTGHNPQFPSP